MSTFFFVSDLHGRTGRYEKLLQAIEEELPRAVLLGGDILPSTYEQRAAAASGEHDFIKGYLLPAFQELRERLGSDAPRILLIMGNDDDRSWEPALQAAQQQGIWEYIHGRKVMVDGFAVYGYSFIPPTPFLLKDWERYDISRFVDPGCVSPEEGCRTVEVQSEEERFRTISQDLEKLAGDDDMERAIFLFHAPPHLSKLDRAALDGQMIDHVPVDVHVGSIAIRRFIEERQPLLTLHGHVHESARLMSAWMDRFGRTRALTAAHDGPELALIRFDPELPEEATRELR